MVTMPRKGDVVTTTVKTKDIVMQYTLDALAERLAKWLVDFEQLDQWQPWFEHVIINDFKCICAINTDYDGGFYISACDWWRENGQRIADIEAAWDEAHSEKLFRECVLYAQAWNEAHEENRLFDALKDEREQLGLAGERWTEFVKRLLP